MTRSRIPPLLVILAVVLLIRLPFLNQAIQGDDIDYLAGAQHAQIEPAHPTHIHYVFVGEEVDMRGHPHPPLNVWALGALIALVGDIREVPFHTGYLLFSLIAAYAMWTLARRLSPHPLWATLLFLAVPAFVINGNSLESDVPFVAFWLAGVALFVAERHWLVTGLALALAAMTAFQAVLLTPIIWLFSWFYRRRSKEAWLLALVPPLTVALWQGYELASSGVLPASVLQGHFQTYGLQALANKLKNAAALSVHLCWIVFPILLPGVVKLIWTRAVKSPRDREVVFLAGWIAIFFAGALVLFFAGSARYLLPIAAPVALLASRLPVRWVATAFGLQMALSLSLAWVNYQHWDAYRQFAASLREQAASHRVWINSGWGLRHYLEAEGGLPVKRGQAVYPGDIVVTSALAYPVETNTGGGTLTPIAERVVKPSLPLRLIGLNTRSAYSTVVRGFLPFDVSTGPLDRVTASLVVEREPVLEFVPMNDPKAAEHLVSGVYGLEGLTRWMGGRAVLLLKSPAEAKPLRVDFFLPKQAPARRVTILLDGKEVAAGEYEREGRYTLVSPPVKADGPKVSMSIVVDRTFSVPGDRRELGIVLSAAGFHD